jgi:hypothetical protein
MSRSSWRRIGGGCNIHDKVLEKFAEFLVHVYLRRRLGQSTNTQAAALTRVPSVMRRGVCSCPTVKDKVGRLFPLIILSARLGHAGFDLERPAHEHVSIEFLHRLVCPCLFVEFHETV